MRCHSILSCRAQRVLREETAGQPARNGGFQPETLEQFPIHFVGASFVRWRPTFRRNTSPLQGFIRVGEAKSVASPKRRPAPESNLDLAAEFDHAVGREMEEARGGERRGSEPQVQPRRPATESRIFGGDKRFAADEEGGGGDVDGEAEGARLRENLGNV